MREIVRSHSQPAAPLETRWERAEGGIGIDREEMMVGSVGLVCASLNRRWSELFRVTRVPSER